MLYGLAALVLLGIGLAGFRYYKMKRTERLTSDLGAAEVLVHSAKAGDAAQEAESEAFRKAAGRSRMLTRARKRLGLSDKAGDRD